MWTQIAVISVLFCLGASLPRDKRTTPDPFLKDVKAGKHLYCNAPGKPTQVEITYFISGMGLYPGKPLMGMEVYMLTKWTDPRLEHSESVPCMIPDHLSHMIWKPDLFFKEALSAKSVDLPSPSRYLKVYNNGSVIRSQRLFLKNHCFNITKSRRSATCHLSLETYGSNTDAMKIERPEIHSNTPGLTEEGIFTWGFQLKGMPELTDCTKTYKTGTFACWKMTATLERAGGSDDMEVDIIGADVDPNNFDN